METIRTTRFSGADWASELKPIMVIGAGGISSWTILNLSRIGHTLFCIDPDTVDTTNVTGGQMYRQSDIGKPKVQAVQEICREFGCINPIDTIQDYYNKDMGMTDIVITGLDNMAARKQIYLAWSEHLQNKSEEELAKCLYIDGRLTLEMFELFVIKGNDSLEVFDKYYKEHLFSDEEANATDCTTKQSTFGAMGIASFITGTLCNWLTNLKYEMDLREVPFYQRIHLPMMQQKHSNQAEIQVTEKVVEKIVEKEVLRGVREDYPGEMQKLRSFHRLVGSLHEEMGKADEVHITGLKTAV